MPTGDAHVHLFANGFSGSFGRLLHDEAALYEQLRQHFGIERALVVGYEGEAAYIGNNAYILALARDRPWIAPLAYLRSEPAPATESLRRLGMPARSAIRCLSDAPEASRRRQPQAVMRELQRQRAIISLNATPAATDAIAPFIDARRMHLPLQSPRASRTVPTRANAARSRRGCSLLALAERQNVAVKLSGLYAITSRPTTTAHGSSGGRRRRPRSFDPRLCWGSDFAPALEFVVRATRRRTPAC
jgi:hypothetical protein